MGSPAAPSPYQQVTSTTKLAPKYEALLGLNADSSAYSPFQALSRQAGAQAKMIEGMTTAPKWSSIYQALGVPQGQDLTPYIQAMRQGTSMPIAPIPSSPEAGTIPEYTNPSDTGKAPKKEAARGGLMSLAKTRGYAPGGTAKALTPQQQKAVLSINKAIEAGTVTDAQKARLDQIEKKTGMNVSPFSETGTGIPKNPKIAKSVTSTAQTYTKQQADVAKGPPVPYSQAMTQEVPFFAGEEAAKKDQLYGGITNPIYQQALDQLRAASKAPETIGQGAGIMSSAAGKLMDQAGYTPQQIDAGRLQGTASQMAQYQQVAAQKADTERAAAAAMNRGDVREVNALMAQVEKYNAALMNAPADIKAQAYEAAQTQGPKSWTDPGTAQQFMSPYMQNVTDIAKRESMRDYGKQLSQLRSQATQSKAFGGTRSAIQEAEAQRGQQQRMSDIEAQGLQQAYQSGMGQFSAEQGLGAQVGMSNTQAMNQQRSQYVAQALEAAKNNYGGQLTAEQQNQVAQNAASQFNAAAQNLANNNYVAQQLQAQLANQQMDFGVGQMNTQNQQQVNLANAAAANQANQQYAQLGLQGQLANQQAGLTTEQQNAQLRQQMALANQNVGLQSAIQNQQAGLTGQGLNLQALNQAGQMGQGLGGLGVSTWGAQQNIPQLWGAAGQTVQNIAQQAANAKQQTGMNWWGGMGNAYQGPTNLLMGAAGQQGTQTTNRIPGT